MSRVTEAFSREALSDCTQHACLAGESVLPLLKCVCLQVYDAMHLLNDKPSSTCLHNIMSLVIVHLD